jgi:hypothetical protein
LEFDVFALMCRVRCWILVHDDGAVGRKLVQENPRVAVGCRGLDGCTSTICRKLVLALDFFVNDFVLNGFSFVR